MSRALRCEVGDRAEVALLAAVVMENDASRRRRNPQFDFHGCGQQKPQLM